MNRKLIAALIVLAVLLLIYAAGKMDFGRDKNIDIEAIIQPTVDVTSINRALTAVAEKTMTAPVNIDRFFKEITSKSEIPKITLAEAKVLYKNKKTLFIDSRSDWDYRDGHIAGALMITSGTAGQRIREVKDQLKGKVLVTYCHGAECHLSDKTAVSLYEAGYRKIAIFFGGWQEWSAAGLPVDLYEPPPGYEHLFSAMIPEKGPVEITLLEAKFLYDQGLGNFIDVDSLDEFNKKKIDKAYSMPVDKIELILPGLENVLKNKPAVIYSRNGAAISKRAAEIMYGMGHKQLLVFEDGLSQWEKAGYPFYKAPGQ